MESIVPEDLMNLKEIPMLKNISNKPPVDKIMNRMLIKFESSGSSDRSE